ncbi:MAG: helix-turn-helix transcriptional regulator [Clostridia bacterium]|nr:helix-turn-helix transcriptional regulator [Clostridia bacterium]
MRTDFFYYRKENSGITVFHSRDEASGDVKFRLQAHRDCELYHFISGTGVYTIEGNEYALVPGCFLLMRDGEAHTSHLSGEVPYERICVNFSPETMPLLQNEIRELYYDRPLGKDNFILPDEHSAPFVAACMERLCCDGESENYEDRARTVLGMLLLELCKAKESAKEKGRTLPIRVGGMKRSAETVRRIVAYINENLTTIKNTDELEREFFFSKAYINRIFKQATGSSVWDYIVLKRLLLARSMLKDGKQASIVAAECGFCDYSSFYRQYRNRFGISPQAARKAANPKHV